MKYLLLLLLLFICSCAYKYPIQQIEQARNACLKNKGVKYLYINKGGSIDVYCVDGALFEDYVGGVENVY